MKKILHTVNIAFAIPIVLGNQINYFNSIGYQVYIACTPSLELNEIKKKWTFTSLEININRKITLFDDLISIYKLIKFIKNNKIDIVVGHTPKGALISMIASYIAGVNKRIYFRHGLVFETQKGFIKLFLIQVEKLTSKLSTKVICVSNSILNQSKVLKISKKDKLFLLNIGSCNGVDSEYKFNPELISKDIKDVYAKNMKLDHGDFIIGYIGRLSKDKGINELIQSWILLKTQKCNANLKLILCGPYDERDPIDIITKKIIFSEKSIIYLGEIDNDNINYYYSFFDIFILPSYREGFPTVILEASSMKLPVITTKSTGCIDSIIENETGIFIEINKISITKSIQFYKDNPNYISTHGNNGRNFIIDNFNQKLIWNKLNEIYTTI